MFNDLFWALYWIEVLSNLRDFFIGTPAFFAGALGVGAIVVAITSAIHERFLIRYGILWAILVTVIGVTASFIPGKQTMYMMLGVKTTDNIVNSETGKKLQEIVNKEIDGYLEKFKK